MARTNLRCLEEGTEVRRSKTDRKKKRWQSTGSKSKNMGCKSKLVVINKGELRDCRAVVR